MEVSVPRFPRYLLLGLLAFPIAINVGLAFRHWSREAVALAAIHLGQAFLFAALAPLFLRVTKVGTEQFRWKSTLGALLLVSLAVGVVVGFTTLQMMNRKSTTPLVHITKP